MIELLSQRVEGVSRFATFGRTTRVVGLVVEATGIRDVPSGPLLNSHTGRSASTWRR